MNNNIFISYRRGQEKGATGRLFDMLEREFGQGNVFLDVDSIPMGRDFVKFVEQRIAECDTLLSFIDDGWVDVRLKDGTRRLDDPRDFVRIELETALKLDKYIIPILWEGAQMPREDQLPRSLAALTYRNAAPLSHQMFKLQAGAVIAEIKKARNEANSPAAAVAPPAQPTRRPMVALASAAAAITLTAAAGALLLKESPTSSPATATQGRSDPPARALSLAPATAEPSNRPSPGSWSEPAPAPPAPRPVPAAPAPSSESPARLNEPLAPDRTVPPAAATTEPVRPQASTPTSRSIRVAAREAMSACGLNGIVVELSTTGSNTAVVTRNWLLPSEGRTRAITIGETIPLHDGCRLKLIAVRPGDWPTFTFDELS